MRNFIVSDLHGCGIVYKSMMDYLNNISKHDDVTLYINGDLIDRGIESWDMFCDVRNRQKEKDSKIKIEYLAGNHELLMLNALKYDKEFMDLWIENGGWRIIHHMNDKIAENEENKDEIIDYISNLKIYHKFPNTIDGKQIVLVHAACPKNVLDECEYSLKDSDKVEYFLWGQNSGRYRAYRGKIGNPDYFTIVGHTPNFKKYGVEYNKDENYLNIDGGLSAFAKGEFDVDHAPLIELRNKFLKILTFNNKNEIIAGNYFEKDRLIPFFDDELKEENELLDKSFKPKKLVLNKSDVLDFIEYEQ